MINSLLVVCFYNRLKIRNVGQYFTKFCGKTVHNGYNSTFTGY